MIGTQFKSYVFAMVISAAPFTLGFAQEAAHAECEGANVIKVSKMGMANEHQLQEHITEIQAKLANRFIHHAHGSSIRASNRLHLIDMQEAMQSLHDQMYLAGCDEAKHGASLDARINALEKQRSTAP